MEVTLFILSAAIGNITTASILRYYLARGSWTHNKIAVILSVCFFLTWFCSITIPLIPSGKIIHDKNLLWFGLALSSLVGIMTFVVTRIILAIKSGSKPRN